MNIGDDWFTKSMLINTLYGNKNLQTQIGNASTEFSQLFLSVLNNILTETDIEPRVASEMSAVPVPSVKLENNSLPPSMPAGMTDLPAKNGTLRFNAISAEQVNRELDGKLQGMGDVFISAGKTFNVNPALLASIAQHETGNGKSRAAHEKNNIAGMMGINGLKSYASVEESIMDMARNISKNYLGSGLTSIAKIGAKYAPIGASNDPTGLNNHWVTGVTKYFNRFSV
ncbi:glucosaminidase domain-containing protein [Neobacillus mesonae]|uniref:glucosaminidase domain-containing protein n=1 Tax=Neobacillus mesonae TaxID=1193713 RepID=UPI00203D3A7B|nr:glucosaminidase domain-containing protein [Neobacillus mesonae]MCM3569596.1 glucosaminidase domain-containing protein [Neobacillus mesonae]